MRTRDIKTIDIKALEWFDKANGNSYFAATVTINYGLRSELHLHLPFQYGYADFYVTAAFDLIKSELNCLKKSKQGLDRTCRENGIILRNSKIKNCKKSELL